MGIFFESYLLGLAAWVLLLTSLVYAYFKFAWLYWRKRRVPHTKPSFPFGHFSNSVLTRKQAGYVFQDIYNSLKNERIVGTYMFTKPGIVIRDPELIKACLVNDFIHFHDRGFFYNSEREPLFGNLFFRNGQNWSDLRIKLSPTFSSGKIKMMFPIIAECALKLPDCVEKTAGNEGIIEAKDILARYTTDVIASCAFGIECNCLKNPNAQFRQWGRKILKPNLQNTVHAIISTLWPSLLALIPLRGLDPKLARYFSDMVQDTVNYREMYDVTRDDFLQLLIQMKNRGFADRAGGKELKPETHGSHESNKLSMEDLAAQVFGFFVAGFETSLNTMTFCLYEMALNPEIQQLVQEEIDVVLAKHYSQITYEAIQDMEYLDKVIAETLRKYPPLPMLNREVSIPYHVPGTDITLHKGTPVVIPIMGLHYDPKYFPDPEKFDPEHFSSEQKAKRHHFVYLPFGEGPRMCIGMRFGLMQTKAGLVAILSRYNVNVSRKTPIPLAMDPKSLTLTSVSGMWLKTAKRKSA